jgi:hypothetical protein
LCRGMTLRSGPQRVNREPLSGRLADQILLGHPVAQAQSCFPVGVDSAVTELLRTGSPRRQAVRPLSPPAVCRRSYLIAERFQFGDRGRWRVTHDRAGQNAPPSRPTVVNDALPARRPLKPAVTNEELDDVLQTRTKPLAAHRNMQRLDAVRRPVLKPRQDVRQRAAMCSHLDV